MSKAYNDIGRLLRGDKKYDEALDYYVLDRDLCRKHQDIIEEAEATRMIGEVYVEQGRFTEGLKHHKQYLSMAIQLQNRVSEQRALATLSWTYLAWSAAEPSRLAKALQYSQKSHAAVARIASKDVDRSERAQMTGRAAENIGKINWRLGDVSEAEESFCEAETSYRGYRHWEDLHRLAVTRAGLVLDTGAEAELGRALAQCRVSLEAAHKLRDPASAEANVDSLVTMFKVHLSMKQFDDARDCLVKARHHSKEDKNVIHHLKMMTVISDSVKRILSGNSDQVTHRPYEQIADALVKFEGSLGEKQRIFKIALEYYTIAFSRASNEGSMECLPDLNNSIAQTYDDIRDYDNALSFFEKQLELERDRSAAERCVTLSNIAMVRENMASGYEVVMEARRRWLDLATTSNNKGQMLAALLEMFRYQKDSGHLQEAEDTRIRIESSGGSVEDADTASSSQRSSCSDVSDKFPEISLEDADEAPRVSTSRIARRTPAEFTRRNNKGESPLHVEIQRVRQENKIISMIERGHPLETEDNAGWTPLGEAVGRMNISYVRIIAEAGANIDHKNHEWETPLIAACQKGFLDGVEYLLERGAKVSVKTKRGVTALGYLKNHLLEGRRPACDPDYKRPGVMERLEAAVVKMETMLTKLGLSTEVQLPLEQDSPSLEDELDDFDHTLTEDSNAPDGPIFCSTQRNRIRSPSPSSESSLPSLPSSPAAVSRSPVKATQIYQDAINSLRSSARPAAQPLAPRPAAGNTRGAEECLDDWLVDDMKRAESKNKRKKPDTGDTDRSEGGVKKQKNIENENPVEDLTLSPTLKTSRNRLSLTRRKSNSKQPKISSLLTRSRTPSPLLPELPPTPAPPSVPSAPAPAAVTCVKVTVASETFLVPVPDPQLTVEWLAQEAAARYCRSLGSEPVLQLRTEDGAALDPRDPLGFIIANFKCIAADVLHWKCKPASEKYRDACRDLGQPSFKNITEKLSSMSSTNALRLRLPLRAHHARPLLSSLRGNLALRDLDLSRCKLEDGVVAQLGPVLPTLPHLASLDLSNNLLTSASISTLAAVSSPSLNKLSGIAITVVANYYLNIPHFQ